MKEDEQTSAVKFNIQIVWESLPQATTFQGLAVASSLTTYPGHPRENTSDGMEFLNHKMLSKTKPPIIFQQLLKWSQPNLPSWYNSWLGPCRDLQNKCLELVMSIQFFIRFTCETFCEKLGIPLNAHISASHVNALNVCILILMDDPYATLVPNVESLKEYYQSIFLALTLVTRIDPYLRPNPKNLTPLLVWWTSKVTYIYVRVYIYIYQNIHIKYNM